MLRYLLINGLHITVGIMLIAVGIAGLFIPLVPGILLIALGLGILHIKILHAAAKKMHKHLRARKS